MVRGGDLVAGRGLAEPEQPCGRRPPRLLVLTPVPGFAVTDFPRS